MTAALGCTHTTVEGLRTTAGSTRTLPLVAESVCVPLNSDGTVDAATNHVTVPRYGLVHVPAGVDATLSSADPNRWICVSAAPGRIGEYEGTQQSAENDETNGSSDETNASSDDQRPTVVEFDALSFELPTTSDVPIARLTAELGCQGMKVNYRRLSPGLAVPYHTEGSQEELFVPLDGPGTLRVADENYVLPAGSVARVAPETPRAAANEGDDDRTWFMVGAPPTGAPDEWDPGAEILE